MSRWHFPKSRFIDKRCFLQAGRRRGQDVLWGRGITRGLTSSICAAADVWRLKGNYWSINKDFRSGGKCPTRKYSFYWQHKLKCTQSISSRLFPDKINPKILFTPPDLDPPLCCFLLLKKQVVKPWASRLSTSCGPPETLLYEGISLSSVRVIRNTLHVCTQGEIKPVTSTLIAAKSQIYCG